MRGLSQITDNAIIVMLGASGDLAKKLLYPALFTLFRRDLLPKQIHIVGYARSKIDHDDFITQVSSDLKDPGDDPSFSEQLEKFKTILSYVSGSYDDGSAFDELNRYLEKIESNYSTPEHNRVFYLALPSNVFVQIAKHLKKRVYSNRGANRLVLEKPLGSDLESAQELVKGVSQFWPEEQTFRIDHYLGKEIVKNILALRFANSFTSGFWDNNHISNVQITLNESFGTEGRGGYFDSAGIIRDVIQNHLCQMLSILTMERPTSLTPKETINEKLGVKLLRAIRPVQREDVLLGQYEGYLDDSGGVPFILKAGKALDENRVEIRVQFKDNPEGLYDDDEQLCRSELIMRLKPGEAILIKLNIKSPGFDTGVIPAELKLDYKEAFPDVFIPEAYEVLLRDVLRGDHSTFVRDDELIAAWKIFTPILHWAEGKDGNKKPSPIKYAFGSRGPEGLDKFLAKFGSKD
ncbi:hypothetical protein GYMLUDRAFT_97342 [Collybiopsis luxurians FD-317 M1]|uniref:Glucose-6-phosphate 1-dehydrogenase n=1 Tax=Collybiopsis luxurians FD-317 M1 TaxID=944289 RepID=A0A0D0B933_9AGAR|nr:hypothetical protein GYMLUDRAFT_97342 [Collybiopsis luxurians FD-317 M1]